MKTRKGAYTLKQSHHRQSVSARRIAAAIAMFAVLSLVAVATALAAPQRTTAQIRCSRRRR